MFQFPTHLYFENIAEELYSHKIFSTPMKLSPSLSLSMKCHVNVFNVHETLIKIGLMACSYRIYTHERARYIRWSTKLNDI